MPVRITKKNGGYSVKTPGGVKAKGTTKAKAEAQANLLRAVEHSSWRPTGKPAKKGSEPMPKTKKRMTPEGMHKMPGGMMMKDSEMKKMMGKAPPKTKAAPKKRK